MKDLAESSGIIQDSLMDFTGQFLNSKKVEEVEPCRAMTLPEWMYFNAWQPQTCKLPDALREHNGRTPWPLGSGK